MDDLMGLAWDPKASGSTNSGPNGRNGASGQAKVKPPVPPVTSKPLHLQMGLKAAGVKPMAASSSSFSTNSTINSSSFTPLVPMTSSSSTASSKVSSAPKKTNDDVFGSLMPSFGQNSASDLTKNLNSMSLEERRRHDQRQQFMGSLSSSPNLTSPMTRSLNSSGSGTPRGYNPNGLAGLASSTSSSPSPQSQSFVSPTLPSQSTFTSNRNQSPSGLLASPGTMGRSISPSMTPLQPSRSNNSSPSGSVKQVASDPFGALLGDQVSRTNPAAKNQSLNSIRYNTPPLVQPTAKVADPWDLDFLANASTATPKPSATNDNAGDLFDLGAFEKAPPEKPAHKRDSMGALNSFVGQSSPMGSPSPRQSPPTSRTAAPKPARSSPAPVPSREDGDIAQIVSMGFSADRAKMALAMTESGRDIEAAVEYLVQNDEAEERLPQRRRDQAPERRQQQQPSRRSRDGPSWPYREDSDPPLEDRRNLRRQQQAQEMTRAQQIQQQKDKLVGTASVFGMSVLSKANEFYKQGREKVQAVMEDMTAEEPKQSGGVRRHEWIEDEYKPSHYKDSDSEDDSYMRRQQPSAASASGARRQPGSDSSFTDLNSGRPRKEKENFENTYVSSSRRGGAGASAASAASSVAAKAQQLFSFEDSAPAKSNLYPGQGSKPSMGSSARPPVARSPSPSPVTKPRPARPPRVLVQASSQQLAESTMFKDKGNEFFKLGQFGQAAEHYARAGQVLPRGHLMLIVVQNNRAAALLKMGEYRETVSECERSIILVQGPDGAGVQDEIPASVGVNLKDQMGKALMRKATALENLEKYREAKEDWVKLRELDPSHRNAADGIRRCEKAVAMVNGGESIASPPVARRVPPPSRPAASTSSSPMQDIFASHQRSNQASKNRADLDRSEGVSKLRQSAAQQEREEDEKLRLRDQVDRKMAMWKAGKEDNIRALIASLGTVLWEGAGWKNVGMHELVTPSQVKIKYMRAIGKMHPDKLTASTTIEQRMMANTIFSTLNSAWDSFKVQNNM